MPIRKIVLVKRKPGLTIEEFRAGYEGSHAPMAVELFGHLWTSYRRNYLTSGTCFGEGAQGGTDLWGYDAISEYVLRDEEALAEMRRIGIENYDRIKQDEALWFDQARCWTVDCETIEENIPGSRRSSGEGDWQEESG